MKKSEQIIIAGAGLSGLSLAYELTKKGITPVILEASARVGGRIETVEGTLGTPLELGATWFSDLHTNLLSLIDELGLEKFHQFARGISLFQTKSFEPPQKFFVPESESPSYRLGGGTQQLIDALVKKIKSNTIKLSTKIKAIEDHGESLKIFTDSGESVFAGKVVLCLPPQLISAELSFDPALPSNITEVLPAVQTWMAGSVKFALEYPSAFWRENGYSGMLYSHAGIVSEMYDHTNKAGNKFGFTGFLNGGAAYYSQEVRKELVKKHLVELFGEQAAAPSVYLDKVWNDKYLISGSPVNQRPHQNNGHPLLKRSYMAGKLLFCGTETAWQFGGYMEGAVASAKETALRLVKD